jgi:RNA polymerase sigma-70 factor (ECF subfamily)
VLDLVVELDPIHRAVLMMRYVDELPVETIARDIGRSLPATYSLLARARAELRGTKGMRR